MWRNLNIFERSDDLKNTCRHSSLCVTRQTTRTSRSVRRHDSVCGLAVDTLTTHDAMYFAVAWHFYNTLTLCDQNQMVHQNGRYFVNNIFKCISLNEVFYFFLIIDRWSLFLVWVELTIKVQHWFMYTKQVTSHHLNQYQLTCNLIWVTRPLWVWTGNKRLYYK